MKYIEIKNTDIMASNIIMGCRLLRTISVSEAENLIKTALEEGVNFFDHADVYGAGICESIFSEAVDMNDDLREKIILQSKCGIIKEGKGSYDFSKEHILNSVEGSLKRLKTDYLDILLLHRPDTLMEPEEVAEAFEILSSSGKVKYFGVSNQNSMQIELLQKYIPSKLIINQLQFSIAHTPMIDSGVTVNMKIDQNIDRNGSILEYCRLKDITIQAWSPFQYGFFNGIFLNNNEKYAELNKVIDKIAQKYGVTNTAVAIGWITRHPAKMQVIMGTTKPQRIIDGCRGSDLPLTRKEWYELYTSAGNVLP